MSSTWYTLGVVSFCCNLTDIRQKPSACFGLCMGMVPKSYQRSGIVSCFAKSKEVCSQSMPSEAHVKGTTKNLSPT
jgi:hypothetical protein